MLIVLITELFKYTIKIIICSTASAYTNNFLIGPAPAYIMQSLSQLDKWDDRRLNPKSQPIELSLWDKLLFKFYLAKLVSK
jgi:hypothetical protein